MFDKKIDSIIHVNIAVRIKILFRFDERDEKMPILSIYAKRS